MRQLLKKLGITVIYRFACPYCGYVKKDSIRELIIRVAERHLAKEEPARLQRETLDREVRSRNRGWYTNVGYSPVTIQELLAKTSKPHTH